MANLTDLDPKAKRALLARASDKDPSLKSRLLELSSAAEDARIAAARTDPNVFVPYILTDEATGQAIQQAPAHRAYQNLVTEHKNVVIHGHVESGKAVPVDTPIPTPGGFVRMGDLSVGDYVFDMYGNRTKITFVSEVQYGRDVYRLNFSDGTHALADDEHQWCVWSIDDLANNKHPRTVTTAEIRKRIDRGKQKMWYVPMFSGRLDYDHKELPVDPYVLGCWLGDGDSQGPKFTCAEKDVEIINRCLEAENNVHGKWYSSAGSIRVCIGGNLHNKLQPTNLHKRLKNLKVINNKHIPEAYKTASYDQRLELLCGLLDTDGHISKTKNRVEFVNTNKTLANDVLELARSLGQKATIKEKIAKLNGREIGPCWRVCWTATIPCFHLKRKLGRFAIKSESKYLRHKTVTSVEPVKSVPVRCIGVEAETKTYLMGRDYTVTHNSQQLSIGRVLFEIGKNPNIRVVICKSTQEDAKKIMQTIANHIMHNQRVKKVFPHLRPGGTWNTEQITVERPNKSIKDPTVRVIGAHGAILGARIDLLIIDDLITPENSRTEHMRNDIYDWIKSVLMGRMTSQGKIVIIGNAWHPDDAMFRLKKNGWPHFVFPVRDPVTKASLWPERWPQDRIDFAFSDKGMGPREAARALDCQARSDDAARFKDEWVQRCLARGRGKEFLESIDVLPLGSFTFTGVDLGVGKELHHDWTVLTTIMAHPNGDFEILRIDAGKWTSPEIVDRIKRTHYSFKSTVYVESNAAQRYIVDFVKSEDLKIPVRSFTTRGTKVVNNKNHPQFGVEGIGIEMSNARWIFPCDENGTPSEQMNHLIQGMLYYDPQGHTSDHLISLWIAREGARKRFSHRIGGGPVEETDPIVEQRNILAVQSIPTFQSVMKREIQDIFAHIANT